METTNGQITRIGIGETSRRSKYLDDSKVTIFMSYEEMVAEWQKMMKKFNKKHE